MYSKKVLEYFKKLKNYGKIENPDGTGKVGNIICGDVMWLYIKIKCTKGQSTCRPNDKKIEQKDGLSSYIITDIKFETFGCVAAISTSSRITEMAKGMNLEEALGITKKEIADSLDGLPPVKMHCSVLAIDALAEAIYDFLEKNKLPIPEDLVKKHIRILKEKEITEEKYKEWK